MSKANSLIHALQYFTGTQIWYKHPLFPSFRYTDGVKYLATHAECYWLLEAIFSYQSIPEIKSEPFQVWKLVKQGDAATLSIEDGNDNVIKEFKIPFTDFPLEEYTLWLTNKVLLLVSEY